MYIINNKQKYILPLLIFLFSVFAWLNRFVQDDAFISFRYARNFARGMGLVYNPGERVEGYSNFLWTVILTIPHLLNIDAVIFSQVTGIILFAISLFVVYRITFILTGSYYLSLAAVLFTGTNYSFLCYATGGLETQLFTCLFLSALYLAFKYNSPDGSNRLILISLILSALLVTRPDSVPYIGITILYLLYKMQRQHVSSKNYISLLLPLFTAGIAFLLWKYAYYGDILPNTYYAKLSVNASEKFGLYYLFTFLKSYLLIVFPFLLILLFNKKYLTAEVVSLFASLIFTAVYIVYAGGDFMEFRFLVPVIPVFFILTVLSFRKIKQRILVFILSLIIITGSFNHAINYKSNTKYRLYSIRELNGQIYKDNFSWKETGILLGKNFKGTDITIATTAAGAIPYYSGLHTIDMHGLNDRHIAIAGTTKGNRPGHQKLAEFDYLQKRNVNLLIGHPFVMWNTFELKDITPNQFKSFFMYDISLMPPDAEIIKIPLQNNYCLFVVYLNKNKVIDEVLERKEWTTRELNSRLQITKPK